MLVRIGFSSHSAVTLWCFQHYTYLGCALWPARRARVQTGMRRVFNIPPDLSCRGLHLGLIPRCVLFKAKHGLNQPWPRSTRSGLKGAVYH